MNVPTLTSLLVLSRKSSVLASTLFLFHCINFSSVGCTVNGQHPSDIMEQIDNGEIEVPEE